MSFLEVTPQMTHQHLPLLHQEITIFMQKWLFCLLNDLLESEIQYKTAPLKADSDQCRLKLL